jgi:hypothetical protein
MRYFKLLRVNLNGYTKAVEKEEWTFVIKEVKAGNVARMWIGEVQTVYCGKGENLKNQSVNGR